jgi:pyruvate/2-oxoglutarate dehydrogenase complex dihydrolipoamide dehydrogenase (E3) component
MNGRIQLTVESSGENAPHRLPLAGSPRVARPTPTGSISKLPELKQTKRFYQVNERLETNVPGIYALGDVKGGPAFTHISYDDFRILRTNLLHGGQATTKDRLVPYTVFIDPQLGRIGLTEEEAKSQGRRFCIAKLPMANVARAIEVDETRGFMKAIIDTETDLIRSGYPGP